MGASNISRVKLISKPLVLVHFGLGLADEILYCSVWNR